MVDEILEQEPARIVCTKRFSGQEDFFTGHYPNMPLVPGVLLCEAAMQAGAILLAAQLDRSGGKVPVVTRINDVRFSASCGRAKPSASKSSWSSASPTPSSSRPRPRSTANWPCAASSPARQRK